MPTYKKKIDFITSDEGIITAELLRLMVLDEAFATEPSFSADSQTYPDNLIPFIDKHMMYLRSHPNTNPIQYISNLRLMTRLRR